MISRATYLALFAATLLTFAGAARGDDFAAGNERYAAGNFEDAKRAYEREAQSGALSANLFYNLGNTEFRLGHEGRAVLNYERALALNPEHPEARANLEYLRNKLGSQVLGRNVTEKALTSVTVDGWTLAAAIAGWIALFAAFLWLTVARGFPAAAIAVAAGLVSLVSISALWMRRGEAASAVVLERTKARLAPSDTANVASEIPAGSEVRLLQDHGGWVYCALGDKSRVWLRSELVERIRRT